MSLSTSIQDVPDFNFNDGLFLLIAESTPHFAGNYELSEDKRIRIGGERTGEEKRQREKERKIYRLFPLIEALNDSFVIRLNSRSCTRV